MGRLRLGERRGWARSSDATGARGQGITQMGASGKGGEVEVGPGKASGGRVHGTRGVGENPGEVPEKGKGQSLP